MYRFVFTFFAVASGAAATMTDQTGGDEAVLNPPILIRYGCTSRFKEVTNGGSGTTNYDLVFDAKVENESYFIEADLDDFRYFNRTSLVEGAELTAADAQMVTVKGFPLVGSYQIQRIYKNKITMRPSCKVFTDTFPDEWRAIIVQQLPEGIRRLVTRTDIRPRAMHISLRNPVQVNAITISNKDKSETQVIDTPDEILAVAQELFLCPKTNRQYAVAKIKPASWRRRLFMLWDKEWLELTDVHRIVIALVLVLSNLVTFQARRDD